MNPSQRSAEEVLDDHLNLSLDASVEDDLRRNYAEDVVLLTSFGTYRGYEGARYLAELLGQQVPDAIFEYRNLLVDGDVGFLEWTATSRTTSARIDDGADSYVFRDGRIVAQTIHYTVQPLG